MKFKLDFGADIELLTRDELGGELRAAEHRWDLLWRTRLAGLRHMPIPVARGTSDGSGDITLGQTSDPDQPYLGPREGYAWRVVRVSVAILGANDQIALYRGDVGKARFVDLLTGTSPAFTASHAVVLHPGDHLVVSTSQIAGSVTANTEVVVSGEVVEAPAEMIGKLIGGG